MRMRLFGKNIRMKLNFRIRSILILFTTAFVFFLLMLNSYISYTTATDIIVNKIDKIEESKIKQVNNKINIAFGEMERLTAKIQKNPTLFSLFDQYVENEENAYQRIKLEKSIVNLFSGVQDVYKDIYSIEAFTEFGNFSLVNKDYGIKYNKFKESNIYKGIKNSNNNIFIMEPAYVDKSINFGFGQFCFCSPLYENGREIGLMFIVMNSDWLNRLLDFDRNIVIANTNENFAVWSGSPLGKEVYDSVKDMLDTRENAFDYRIGSGKYRIHHIKTKYSSWAVLSLKNTQEISAEIKKVKRYSVISYFISMGFCIFAAFFFSNVITKSIHQLMKVVRKYRANSISQPFKVRKNRINLKNTFMLYFLTIIIVPLLINSFTQYFTLSGFIEKKIKESIVAAFEQTTNNINYFISINERISKSIIIDKGLKEYLLEKMLTPGAEVKDIDFKTIQGIIDENMFLGESVFEATLYDKHGKNLYSTTVHNTNDLDREVLKKMSSTLGEPVWTYYDKDKFNRNTVKVFRKVIEDGNLRNGKYQFQTVGYLGITYYEANIEELYRDVYIGDSNVFIADKSGHIVSHRVKSMVNQRIPINPVSNNKTTSIFVEGKGVDRTLAIYSRCENLPWIMIGQVPYREIMKDNQKILYVNILLFILTLLPIVFASNYMSYRITKPLNQLARKLLKFGKGDMVVDFMDNSQINEIQELGNTFNLMSKQIQDLIEKVYKAKINESRLESERKESELVALKAQINPHFLYNTLESIIWLVKDDEKDKAAEMIAELGELFRLGVKKGNEFITIREEIEYEKTYLNIHEYRLGDKLKVVWDVDEKLLTCKIPKIILQPIIENAIQHGIQENEAGGVIFINCREDNGMIVFMVEDNGPGISMEQLDDINLRLAGNLTGNSIGIYNVQKRIQLYYGNDYGITIKSIEGRGTSVIIRLPKENA